MTKKTEATLGAVPWHPVLALALLLAPPAATAADAPAPAPVTASDPESGQASGPRVRVRADPSVLPVTEATLRRALTGHLADLDAELTVDLAPGHAEDPRSRSDFDLDVEIRPGGDGGLQLQLTRPMDEPWVRALPPEVEPDLLLESLGVVLRGIVSELPPREPEPPEPVPTPPARAPAPAPDTEAPADPGSDLTLSAGVRGDPVSAEHPWHTGVAVDLGWRAPRTLGLHTTLAWVPRHTGGDLELTRWVGSALFGASFRRDSRVQPGVWTMGTVEAVGWRSAPLGARPQPGWAVRGAVGIAADLRVTLGPRWVLMARVSADAWVRRLELVESSTQGPRILTRTAVFSGSAFLAFGYRWTLGPSR